MPRIPSSLIFIHTALLQRKFDVMGGAAFFGPVERKRPTVWYCRHGAVVCDLAGRRAFEVHGAICRKWRALGGAGWGRPTCDEMPTPDGSGRVSHFTGGRSIYRSPRTPAVAVGGDIRGRWDELGGVDSYLGYPIGDEEDFSEDGRRSRFQHGSIYWWNDSGAIDLTGISLSFTGLKCLEQMPGNRNSTDGGPCAVIGIAAPDAPIPARAFRSRVFHRIDRGDTGRDSMEVFRGEPLDITIMTLFTGHRSCAPDRCRAAVQTLVEEAVGGTRSQMELERHLLSPPIAGSKGGRIGHSQLVVSGRQLVLFARQATWNDGGVDYKLDTSVAEASGGRYKAYFNVLPI